MTACLIFRRHYRSHQLEYICREVSLTIDRRGARPPSGPRVVAIRTMEPIHERDSRLHASASPLRRRVNSFAVPPGLRPQTNA